MRLTNANVADIEFHMLNNKNPDLMSTQNLKRYPYIPEDRLDLDRWRYHNIC